MVYEHKKALNWLLFFFGVLVSLFSASDFMTSFA